MRGNVYEKNGFWKQIIARRTSVLSRRRCTEKNVHFQVIVTFKETELEASEHEVELSAIQDASEDFLSEEELNYYLNLKDLWVIFGMSRFGWLILIQVLDTSIRNFSIN